jgi:DnaD/phage-associated family protein
MNGDMPYIITDGRVDLPCQIEREIIDYAPRIGIAGVGLYTMLVALSRDGANVRATARRLASLLGCSERHVIDTLKVLEQAGLIARLAQFDDRGAQCANRIVIYRLHARRAVQPIPAPADDQSEEQEGGVHLVQGGGAPGAPLITTTMSSDPPRREVYDVWEQEIGPLTPHIADALREYEERCTTAWVCDAIRLASSRGKRNWAYIAAILNNWHARGRDDHAPRPQPLSQAEPQREFIQWIEGVSEGDDGG